MQRVAIVLALLISGCMSSAQQHVDAARVRWKAATGLTTGYKHATPPLVVGKWGVFPCAKITRARGCYNPVNNILSLNIKPSVEPEVQQVAVHEIAHWLGAHHTEKGVLSSDASGACIDTDAVEAVCSVRACPHRKPECS